jgi:hypothetical protein
MQKLNAEWFTMNIPGTDVKEPRIYFIVVAVDNTGNSAASATEYFEVGEAQSVPQPKTKYVNAPANIVESKSKSAQSSGRLELISISGDNEVTSYPDQIVIRNKSSSTINHIRITLSPEISKSFRLNHTAITSIAPNGNVTIALEVIGNPNRNMFGGLTGYNGNILVAAENHSPILLPVNISAEDSYYLNEYTDKVAGIAEQRYNKVWLINSILPKHQDDDHNYEVITPNKDNIITSPADELIIRNLTDKELTNVRIFLNGVGRAILLEQNAIHHLEPNAQISIKLISKIDTMKYSPKDVTGELLIVPSNDKPIQIPINIPMAEFKNSMDDYTVKVASKDNVITKAVDTITIENIADRSMDSVKISLSDDLNKMFSLSNETFKHIQPGEKVTVELKYNKDLRTFMQDYSGELLVLSEHHNLRKIPIKIEWKQVSGKYFTMYARAGDESLANNIVKMLDNNYDNLTARFGTIDTKTTIYMTGSIEEMKLINESGHPYYSYTDNTIFICSCDEPSHNALKEFVSKLMINNYATYHHIQKFTFDQQNWLLDGLGGYIAADLIDTGLPEKYFEAFDKAIDIDFRWKRSYSDAQYGATYTFFEFLEEKYGVDIIDKAPEYLRSGMISNHRCSTLEECVVIRAAYDVSGLDMSNKRLTLSFDTLVEEWEDYVKLHYQFEPNAFQKTELEKALAKQKAGISLTASEEEILELAKYIKGWARSLGFVN